MNYTDLSLLAGITALVLTGAILIQTPGAIDEPAHTTVEKPNIVMVAIDALPAGHVGPCYGYRRNTTPNICKLAEKGTQFDQAYSTASWSLPSYTSLFSGKYPHQESANIYHDAVKMNTTTLAEVLQEHGYETSAYVDGAYLQLHDDGNLWQFDQGFKQYRYYHRNGSASLDPAVDQLPSKYDLIETGTRLGAIEDIVPDVIESLNETQEPFFTFIHSMDTHAPYYPQNLTAYEKFLPDNNSQPLILTDDAVENQDYTTKNLSTGGIEQVKAAYDASVRHTDYQLGKLFSYLRRSDQMDDTIIILLSDHGEAFNSPEGYFGHSKYLYQEYIHVPLVIDGPGFQQKTVDTPVSLIDIYPTILDSIAASEENVNQSIEGTSLLRKIPPYRVLQSETVHKNRNKQAAIANDTKLIWDHQNGLMEQYNLEEDPKEDFDVFSGLDNTTKPLYREMKQRKKISPSSKQANGLPDSAKKQLDALGYLE